MTTFRLTINNQSCSAQKGQTILEVATANGIEIPTLCHHPLVKEYGACGVCLVEDENSLKLYRACATEARENMVIHTDGERAESARKTALDLIFSDHRGDCRPPCSLACPGETDCQIYAALIANGKYDEALEIIKEAIPLPASIGRICPHPCETACRRSLVEEPVALANLKAFAGDMALKRGNGGVQKIAAATGKKVTVIGGGPGGLTAAWFLAQKGHNVEIIEAMPKAGGMLRYGIPQYRLPKDILDREISFIEDLGVTLHCNKKVGTDISFEEIKSNSDAVFIAIGAWQSAPLRCKGEEAQGVFGGIDFLVNVAQGHCPAIGKSVAVVGGGNTAMDACRTAKRLGAEKVYVLYRRTQAEMPAEDIEITEAMEEGVEFRFLVAPLEILATNGKVSAIRLQKMTLGEADASGRRRPVPIEGDIEELPLNTVIAAIGQKVVPHGLPVALTDWNTIKADDHTFRTDIDGVFAAGDATNNGPGIAIEAIGDAHKAANVIHSYLQGDIIPYSKPFLSEIKTVSAADFTDEPKLPRQKITCRSAAQRRCDFNEVSLGFSEAEAKAEASRCLACGCSDYYDCKLIGYGQRYDLDIAEFGDTVRKRNIADANPYILRNSDKCILCGLCIRVCEEVVGQGVLGLVNRGFHTIVKPEFGIPLEETDCISCGQCVNVCPTGALTAKQQLGRDFPTKSEGFESSCGQCGLNCKTKITAIGSQPVEVSPREATGLLCKTGKFGYGDILGGNRVVIPYIKGKESDFTQASAAITRKAAAYGKDEIGVLLAPGLSKEEITAYCAFAKTALNTTRIASPAVFTHGISGEGRLSDIAQAKNVLYVGTSPLEDHPVLGMKLHKSGAAVTCVQKEEEIDAGNCDLVIVVEKAASAATCQAAANAAKSNGAKLLVIHAYANLDLYQAAGVQLPTMLSQCKALAIFGDTEIPTDKIPLVAAVPRHSNATNRVEILLPFAVSYETGGTVACNCGNEFTKTAALPSPFGLDNIALLQRLK